MKTEIYTYLNPMFLSDRFVFKSHPILGTVYVKINYMNKIEEIGSNIERRTMVSMDNIMKSKLLSKSTKLERGILNRIDESYFLLHCKK